MSTQNVLGFTKLIFKPKSEIKDEIPEFLSLYLNCENMAINSVKLDKSQKVSDDSIDQGGRDCGMKINGEKKIIIPLGYKNTAIDDYKKYITGKTISLDVTDRNGNESRHDRIAKASDAEALTLESLIELSIRINLLNSVELKDLLVNGGTVNIHFWDSSKDFRYRQLGNRLEKI